MMWCSGGGGVNTAAGFASACARLGLGEFRQALDRLLELLRQITVARDAVAFSSVERVFAGPAAKDHFGMVEEIAVDCDFGAIDRKRGNSQPLRVGMVGRLAWRPLAQKQDVGDDGRAFAFESVGWQAGSPPRNPLSTQDIRGWRRSAYRACSAT